MFDKAKLEVPGTVRMPVWVSAPAEMTARFWPTVEAVSTVARLLVSAASLAPLLLKVTAPVSTLF